MRDGDWITRQVLFSRQRVKPERVERQRVVAANPGEGGSLDCYKCSCNIFLRILTGVFSQVQIHLRNATVEHCTIVCRRKGLNNPGLRWLRVQSDTLRQYAGPFCILRRRL